MISAEGGHEEYLTQLSNELASIQADTTESNGGSGKYFRPHDLLCAGFASCLNITVRMILKKMGLQYDRIMTKVDIDRSREDQTVFLYDVKIIGDIDTAVKEMVISQALNCPVKKTLSKNIAFEPMSP